MQISYVKAGFLTLLLMGCGASNRDAFSEKLESMEEARKSEIQDPFAAQAQPGADEADRKQQRKIIYNTQLSVVVDDFDQVSRRMRTIAEEHDGFVSDSQTDQRTSDRRSGRWVIRVPVDSYSALLAELSSLGHTESQQETASNVTEQYVDAKARISNNRELERRILAMLEKNSEKIENILRIESELARVREEVERMEGRLRVLEDQISLATITIQVREEKQYVPPTSPTFTQRIASTFGKSVSEMKDFSQGLFLMLVAIAPWAFIAALVGWPIYQLRRRRRLLTANNTH